MKIAFVAAFAAVAGYGVYANQQSEAMSDLMLANVEALADCEITKGGSYGFGLNKQNVCFSIERIDMEDKTKYY